MERIASFTINHLNLMPGLYVSRRDAKGDCVTTTFDLRITAPNREPVIDTPALHTIEHLAATYLRNCESKEDMAKYYIRKYRDSLKKDRNLVYPE